VNDAKAGAVKVAAEGEKDVEAVVVVVVEAPAV
jgi:hypothetical protein